jgi:Cyclic nucleotide-binding domain
MHGLDLWSGRLGGRLVTIEQSPMDRDVAVSVSREVDRRLATRFENFAAMDFYIGFELMLHQVSERRMHWVRWIVTGFWVLLIGSLLYDPLTPWLTQPDNRLSPLRIDPAICVQVQGQCLLSSPYAIGTTIFWGAVVPSSIFILLIFGHELWRRICPLSFLSQLPRALGWQRQFKRVNAQTGKTRLELAKVKPDSWLGKNHLYLQFGLLYCGLCARILFINADRTALFIWFVGTIGAAITVGYLYGGKTWCNYFCPMSPVQKIYGEPGGWFNSKAHTSDAQITQSMCRSTGDDGKEQSACVACQTPCIDIDAERSYWDGLMQPETRFLYYSYVGLVVGYFAYYYLYAGNWNYYFSGAWAHQSNQLQTLLDPGFYLLGQAIAVPKLFAVPLTLAGFSAMGYGLGRWIEPRYRRYGARFNLSPQTIRHRLFTLCTFLVFHCFFIFAGRPLLLLLPLSLQFLYEMILVSLSTLWLYRTWHRSSEQYGRESLTSRLRRQLAKLQLNLTDFLAGRTLADLNTDEVFVLAKVLPGFTKEKRYAAYKGVLGEALGEGYVDTASSLAVLQHLRSQLDISEAEHRSVLLELGVEDPQLLDPQYQRSRENQVRLTGYRRALERLVRLQQQQLDQSQNPPPIKRTIAAILNHETHALRTLRREYGVTLQEQAETVEDLDPETRVLRRSQFLLGQLANLVDRYRALNQPALQSHEFVLKLLRDTVLQNKRLLVTGILEILEHLMQDGATAIAWEIATALECCSPAVLQDILSEDAQRWPERLDPAMMQLLRQPGAQPIACPLDLPTAVIAGHLAALLAESSPLIQAVSLYMLDQIAPDMAIAQADSLLRLGDRPHAIVQQVATTIMQSPPDRHLATFSHLEKLVNLDNSDFFGGIQSETLMALADRATVQTYERDAVITAAGDTCRELLLLIEGVVTIQQHLTSGEVVTASLLPGYVLDELEVLSHRESISTIVAQAKTNRVLAIPVDALDDLLEHDRDFARRMLELESRRLQQVVMLDHRAVIR